MAQYIDKDAVVAEIKELKDEAKTYPSDFYCGRLSICKELMNLLETLDAKVVDLEEELKSLIEKEKAFVTDNREVKYYNGDSFNHIYELEFIAKHFFELGLKVQKGGEE